MFVGGGMGSLNFLYDCLILTISEMKRKLDYLQHLPWRGYDVGGFSFSVSCVRECV